MTTLNQHSQHLVALLCVEDNLVRDFTNLRSEVVSQIFYVLPIIIVIAL